MSEQPTSNDPMAAFGPNEWLVDELYQQYLSDKNSVDRAWWSFFEDYQPDRTVGGGNGTVAPERPAPAAAPAPTSAPSPAATAPQPAPATAA
ncbi:MAG: hypothetical protein L0H79_20530, partial [Intrasporangium sp.]|uniref:2-oxoglutarate dehydrogenase E1 subunit family protein n=1 Tax=Intrasporangium sp. TaxID=1925024 RepID=UPI00264A40F6